ncbi:MULTISPECIES: aldehyde dehydrogenase family protein [Pseudomonas]|uniref:aldehyde dehydrogenase family protein n=1 Tax=Pseudomonas TaxID=286 RepID=UPI00051D8FA9|nr:MULTISPECIES: aldehyde dehydrogenase family protein [Pseudomonas]KGK25424.1 aldehyde dehydrogenase [Pseudomonas plecoglossicida]MDH0131727.1 aldehyde dehydrogenase family protein [Pseudomonas asiatica]QNV67930.1 aldehyde dehydrogenase family protein [Pseudomonas sp. CFA]
MSSLPLQNAQRFYINGQWVAPERDARSDVINPATEQAIGQLAMGASGDVDRAVAAAKAAFPAFSGTSREERLALLERVLEAYNARLPTIAEAMTLEMGAPAKFSRQWQAGIGTAHIRQMIQTLKMFEFTSQRGTTRVVKEPIGVVALITPWNWPINQIACKVLPALAAGCTMVLKPSELAPYNAVLFAEALHEAGVPPGVFNLVQGDGPSVGQPLASHPDVDMVSFTGSTRAGVIVAKAAADTVKRVHQELGGKSANILLPDCDFPAAVELGVLGCFSNAGQSCNAPTRMLVPRERHEQVVEIAREVARNMKVADPFSETTDMGPVISAVQFQKIQAMIATGIEEGAQLVCGGLGRPAGLERGHFVQPTVFADVHPTMTIAREEIFGPVLAILPYDSVEQAIAIANDSVFGLAGYVQGADPELARRVAAQLRVGTVYINYPAWDPAAPFGGYKQSGNGREYADFALHDFLETKGIVGYGAA